MEVIQTKATAVEPCHYSLEITIPVDIVDAGYKQTIKGFGQHASIPGFRPGKSPIALVRKRFGDKIKDQVTQELMQEYVPKAIDIEKLEPATMPSLPDESKQAEEGKAFTFTIEFDVEPEVTTPTYKGLELERPKVEITEEMVDEYVNDLRSRQADYQAVEREAQEGDLLKVSYQAEAPEDDEIPPDAERMLDCENTYVMLTEPEIFPGANSELIGASAGDSRTAQVTFPEDYRQGYLAGKSFSYTFTVHEVQAQVMPEMTDDLAKTMGADTVDELHTMIREHIQSEIDRMQQQALQSQVYEKLMESVDFDLPPRIVQQEEMNALRQLFQEAQQQGQAEDLTGRMEEMRAKAQEQARNRVKMRYIVEAIADAENIHVQDVETAAYVQQFKQRSGMTDAQFDRQYDENAVAQQGRQTILGSRVVGLVIEQATIVDKEPAPADEAADSEAAAKAAAASTETPEADSDTSA